jgi:3-methyladenine DNA glycosylase AlkD
MTVCRPLVDAVRAGLAEAADPARAPAMQAYMKSAMPSYGVALLTVRAVTRAALAAHPLPDREAWTGTVTALWDEAGRREERYAALALAGSPSAHRWQDPATLALYRRLVVDGAWWDLVDDLATHKVGPVLRSHRAEVTPMILDWSRDEDLWLRRTAILSQVGARGETDPGLLAACVEPNLADRQFFVRKAIGWALRDYAYTDPAWVAAYVDRAGDRMSGLSRREASKHLARLIAARP